MKIDSIQGLRALAAWMVVLHHVHQVFWQFDVTSLGGWLAATRGSVGVDLFFVISGFVMVVATRSGRTTPLEFLWRRLARIAPAYWLSTIAFAGLLLAFPALVQYPFRLDPLHFALSASFLSSLHPDHFFPVLTVGWSLNFEMLFYVLLAIGIAVAGFTGRVHLERWLVPAFIIALVLLYPWRWPGVDMFRHKLLLTFAMGYLLGVAYVEKRLPLRPVAGLVLIGIGIGVILSTERNWFVIRGLACTAIVWGCLCREADFARAQALSRLGDWSYSTYLVHLIVLMLARELFIAAGGGNDLPWIAAALALTLLLSVLSFRYVEQPGLRLFHRTPVPRPG